MDGTDETFDPGTAVDVLCDGSGRLGPLSYRVPEGLKVRSGDAVHVPFGRREVHGVVLGPGDPAKATRDVLDVFGRRTHQRELAVVDTLARRHFSDRRTLAARLSPPNGRGAHPLDPGPVRLRDDVASISLRETARAPRRYLLRAPLVDPVALAAREATRLAATGQVLVLCPTVALVEEILAQFASGTARVDKAAEPGAWRGLVEGTLPVAIGTRSAALYSAANLAGIVVVEEDHPGHREERQPYTHAREVALARAQRSNLALSLIGAAPSPPALAGVRVVPVGTKRDWPRIKIVDRNDFPPHAQLVPPPILAALERARRAGKTPAVLTVRTQSRRRCSRCGIERPCRDCQPKDAACKHNPNPCPSCGEIRTRMTGWDARRLTELLGEPLVATGLAGLPELDDTGCTVVFDIDAALSMPSMYPEELATYQLVAAASSAGRGGTLWVPTRNPQHPLLCDLLVRRDQVSAARRAWSGAKQAGLPPFERMVKVSVARTRAPNVSTWPGRVLGPRRKGKNWEVLVRLPDCELPELSSHIERLRRGGKLRVTVT